jgi:hypothetical protein
MEPAGLTFGVIAVFKDAYLTAKFIRNTIRSMKGYHGEQAQLVMHFTVQIYRLKNLSRLFRAADGNKVDMKLLETVPDVRQIEWFSCPTMLSNSRTSSIRCAISLDSSKRF